MTPGTEAARPEAASPLRWVASGTALFTGAMASLTDEQLTQPSRLPSWSRRHLLAHVAANAEALGNLVRWASTGDETPMYSSPEQRNNDIESGATRPVADLRDWVVRSAAELDAGLIGLGPDDWRRPVRTAQGRVVPATEIGWLRVREVMIHAVDLGADVLFDDLPADFLVALVDDVTAKRSRAQDGPALVVTAADNRWVVTGTGDPRPVEGSLPDVAAYLTGRSPATVTGPDLPRWL